MPAKKGEAFPSVVDRRFKMRTAGAALSACAEMMGNASPLRDRPPTSRYGEDQLYLEPALGNVVRHCPRAHLFREAVHERET